jgi:hypothetical protein
MGFSLRTRAGGGLPTRSLAIALSAFVLLYLGRFATALGGDTSGRVRPDTKLYEFALKASLVDRVFGRPELPANLA